MSFRSLSRISLSPLSNGECRWNYIFRMTRSPVRVRFGPRRPGSSVGRAGTFHQNLVAVLFHLEYTKDHVFSSSPPAANSSQSELSINTSITMLSPEIPQFCQRWLCKADESQKSGSLSGCFDAFFSYFVTFNRLYGTAYIDLLNKKGGAKTPNDYIPDRKASTTFTAQYIGQSELVSAIEGDQACADALSRIASFIQEGRFYFKLGPQGQRQPEEDQKLLTKLISKTPSLRAKGILEVIYSIRCNMFHGHKGFDQVQTEVLIPTNIILRKVIELLLAELQRSHQ
jgi:hypothetical protein